jgi:Methane oxygenase PmoA
MASKVHRVRIEPLAERRIGFFIGQAEVTCWHFSDMSPRPYFFPVNGPSGQSLTRMGHPGAPNHDHHRSFWFAHADLLGIDFWSENTAARIRQSQWYAIEDGTESARIAFELLWTDGHDPQPLLKQDVFATLRALPKGWTLELQNDFRATADGVEFRHSNFGVLGLRVAKSLSVVFGGGQITGADGREGEAELFGKPNRWIDYSGPIFDQSTPQNSITEGLTLVDHAHNPSHPAKWHVREDGWIGPSISLDKAMLVPREQPLTMRYLLYVHPGGCDSTQINSLAAAFDASSPLQVRKGTKPHQQFEIVAAGK